MTAKLIGSMKVTKRELLELQKEIGKMYEQTRDFMVAKALTTCAQAIKIEHAIGLLETQGITPLYKYFLDLEKNKKSAATRNVLNDASVINAIKETKELFLKGVEHPKLDKLVEIVKEEIKRKSNTKIIVFANYRSSVEKIAKLLEVEGIEAREFIGQAVKNGKGLKQKEQIEILNEFDYELFNVLCSTSIGEEGLSLPAVDMVIFYEPVPSEIRTIQRRGRTARTRPGRVIFLITKGTRDEGYYWSAYHKERKMRRILRRIQGGFKVEEKKLSDYFGRTSS
jgi:Fanconi anemia group M protein